MFTSEIRASCRVAAGTSGRGEPILRSRFHNRANQSSCRRLRSPSAPLRADVPPRLLTEVGSRMYSSHDHFWRLHTCGFRDQSPSSGCQDEWEDWGRGTGQRLKKIHGAVQRCMIILEYDELMCQRFSFTRGSAQPRRFRLSEREISSARQSSPRSSFPNRTGELSWTGPDNGEVKIGGPGLAKFTLSYIDVDRITSVGFRRATVQGPGGWGGNEGEESIKWYVPSRWKFADSLLTAVMLGRGFIRRSALCPLSISTASEFVRITSRSVRTEVRRCASKGGQFDNIPRKLVVVFCRYRVIRTADSFSKAKLFRKSCEDGHRAYYITFCIGRANLAPPTRSPNLHQIFPPPMSNPRLTF